MSADTIYALSSAPGKAGVAVVRVSGERAGAALLKLTDKKALPAPRQLELAWLKNNGQILDKAMAVYFKAPHSFTGEDVVEFHVHGGRAVVQALCAALSGLEMRMAEPGEFTRRATLNGKLDLTEAEGLADLIAAETEAQRAQALRQMGGALSKIYESWREELLRILAHAEADIDFPDEDLPPHLLEARVKEIGKLIREIENHLNDARRGERLREGFSIAILGAPNAGKSSLINALAQREAAIVSARAGTTRDVVEVHLDLGGYPVILADTAGLREAEDEIEVEGIRRALARAKEADLKIVLFDAASTPDKTSLDLLDEKAIAVFSKTDISQDVMPAQAGIHGKGLSGGEAISMDSRLSAYALRATADKHAKTRRSFSEAGRGSDGSFLAVSSKTGAGIPELLNAITQRLKRWMEENPTPPLTRERHREALLHALQCLRRAETAVKHKEAYEITAEELRQAAQALGRITGRVDIEDVLDVIFKDFCIGK
jgi:tRNA modification GTPase